MNSILHQIHWRPTSSAPSLMGWITFAAYFITSIASLILSYRKSDPVFCSFWIALSLILLILGINRLLDLQSYFTGMGRVISREQGWYGNRRKVQYILVVATFAVTMVAIISIILKINFVSQQFIFPATGLLLLLGFLIIQAISLHRVDRLMKLRLIGIKINWFFELCGIGIILVALLWEFARTGINCA